jgi:Ca-activated chloride channel family protein
MELENRHILRILAYRLLQADQTTLAVPLLERVHELAPDEPQSSRDLALALASTQPQRALDLLWDVASRPWDGRFADIDLIALTELNALAARTPKLNLSRVDARLRQNLPLDLRAVLTWDADNTDIDLWVTDPDGEKAYYAHRLTRQGGAMSRDFTGGYGPEEFSLRRAKPGRYEVRAQFFGHRQQLVSPYTTLMLWLSTGFGKAAQKDERVVLRLSGSDQQVLVGSFEVEEPARGAAK